MSATGSPTRPPGWAALEHALRQRRPVQLRYHGQDRVVFPHALGWKNGRPKLLAYQAEGTTSKGPLPDDPCQRWRSLFIDEIEDALLLDSPWQTAANYSPSGSNCIDQLEIALPDQQP